MTIFNENCRIVSNEELGRDIWLMRLESASIAQSFLAGQFVDVLVPGMPEHLLRRPFGIYDSQDDTFEILYQVIGPGTTLMSGLETGLSIEVMGPIGKAWNPPGHIDEALLVAGGVGSAPIYPLAKELVGRGVTVSVVLGASTAEALVSREKFGGLTGAEPMCATDDGTYGRAGFCSQIAEDLVDEAIRGDRMIDYIACCGPDPLMKKVGRMAIGAGIICELSLERRMACGIGACLSCVVDTRSGKSRVCVDGPVFNAAELKL